MSHQHERMNAMRGLSLLATLVVLMFNSATSYSCFWGVCNDYMQERICDRNDNDYTTKFQSNSTHVNIGFPIALTTFISLFFEEIRIGVGCAVEEVNNDPDFLNGITLDVVFADDRPTMGIEAGYCFADAGITVAVGPVASNRATSMSMLGRTLDTHYIGIWPTSGLLSNKDPSVGYPTFSRVISSDQVQGHAIVQLCIQKGWSRIATLSNVGSSYGEGVLQAIVTEGTPNNIFVQKSATVGIPTSTDELHLQLQLIKDSGVRVVVVAINQEDQGPLIFEAFHAMNMTNGEYVLITTETLVRQITSYPIDHSNGVISVSQYIPPTLDDNSHYDKLHKCFYAHEDDTDGFFAGRSSWVKSKPYEPWMAFAYDAVLVAAHAIDNVGSSNLADMEAIREALTGLEFVGASGKLHIDANGDRRGGIHEVVNRQGDEMVMVALVDSADRTYTTIPGTSFMYPGNQTVTPLDFYMKCTKETHYAASSMDCRPDGTRSIVYTPLGQESRKYCPPLPPLVVGCDHPTFATSTIAIAVVTFGMVVAIVQLLLLIKYWNQRQVKSGQPFWLALLILGAMITMGSSLLQIGKVSSFTCFAPTVGLTVGIAVQFMTLNLKSLRVSKILVRNKNLKRVSYSDSIMVKNLMCVIIGLIVLLALKYGQDPPIIVEYNIVDSESKVQVPVRFCSSQVGTYDALLAAYMGAIILYTCKIAFEVRNVKEEFSEAFHIFVSVYNATLCILAAATFSVVSLQLPAIQHAVFAVAGVIGSIGNTALLIFPKLLKARSAVSSGTISKNIGSKLAGTDTQDGVNVVFDSSGNDGKANAKIAELLDQLDVAKAGPCDLCRGRKIQDDMPPI